MDTHDTPPHLSPLVLCTKTQEIIASDNSISRRLHYTITVSTEQKLVSAITIDNLMKDFVKQWHYIKHADQTFDYTNIRTSFRSYIQKYLLIKNPLPINDYNHTLLLKYIAKHRATLWPDYGTLERKLFDQEIDRFCDYLMTCYFTQQ